MDEEAYLAFARAAMIPVADAIIAAMRLNSQGDPATDMWRMIEQVQEDWPEEYRSTVIIDAIARSGIQSSGQAADQARVSRDQVEFNPLIQHFSDSDVRRNVELKEDVQQAPDAAVRRNV